MTVFKIFVFILALTVVYKLLYFISKRIFLIYQLYKIKSDCGASVKFLRCPFLSLFTLTDKPDATVEAGDTVYIVRFLNGFDGLHFMHFASREYFVTFIKSRFFLGGRVKIRDRFYVTEHKGYITTSAHSVKILPELSCELSREENDDFSHKKVVPVLILNPAPCEVSYVTETRNSIKVAFTGDEIYGSKIFTATTFRTHVDRQKREEDRRKREIFD